MAALAEAREELAHEVMRVTLAALPVNQSHLWKQS